MLFELLSSSKDYLRCAALESLLSAKNIKFKTVSRYFRSPDVWKRRAAFAIASEFRCATDDDFLEALLACTQDEDCGVRSLALQAGANAEPASNWKAASQAKVKEILPKLLNDACPRVRLAAARLAGRLRCTEEPILQDLVRLLRDRNVDVFIEGALALLAVPICDVDDELAVSVSVECALAFDLARSFSSWRWKEFDTLCCRAAQLWRLGEETLSVPLEEAPDDQPISLTQSVQELFCIECSECSKYLSVNPEPPNIRCGQGGHGIVSLITGETLKWIHCWNYFSRARQTPRIFRSHVGKVDGLRIKPRIARIGSPQTEYEISYGLSEKVATTLGPWARN